MTPKSITQLSNQAEQWLPLAVFPIDKDLSPLIRLYHQRRVPAKVTEERGQQQLWALEGYEQTAVLLAQEWLSGASEPTPLSNTETKPKVNWPLIVQVIKQLPLTVGLLLLGFIGTLFVPLGFFDIFLFQSLADRHHISVGGGDYWRLITPIFLHFGAVHYIFNAIMIWAAGQRVEIARGSLAYLGIVLFIALVSNVAQFMLHPNIPFGGLSGVAYGILGYIMVYQRFIKDPILNFPPAIIILLLVNLLLGVFGVFDLFLSGGVANGAHLAGLFSGMLLGGIRVMVYKSSKSS